MVRARIHTRKIKDVLRLKLEAVLSHDTPIAKRLSRVLVVLSNLIPSVQSSAPTEYTSTLQAVLT